MKHATQRKFYALIGSKTTIQCRANVVLVGCLVGKEACGSAHHWAREIVKLGHT